MESRTLPGETFEFGPFELDTVGRRLSRDGETIPLQPKIFTLLEFLVRHPSVAFSRDELMEEVWPGVLVSDQSLTEAISRLRAALDDSPSEPRYIETIRAYGFRFVASVECADEDAVQSGVREPQTVWPPLWKLALPGAGLSGLLLVIALAAGLLTAGSAPTERVALTEITYADGAAVRDFAAEVSPDGDQLAFVRSDPPRLLLMDIASEETRTIGELSRVWNGRRIRWAPDGSAIAMADRPERGGPGVLRLFDLQDQTDEVVLEWAQGPIGLFGWSPNGQATLVWAQGAAEPQLLVVGRDGTLRGGWEAGRFAAGRISPDGRWLALSLYDFGDPFEIVIAPIADTWDATLQSTSERFHDWQTGARITNPPVADDAPRWNAGSSRLLFFSGQGGSRNLWTVEVADGQPVGQPRPVPVPGGPYRLHGWTTDRHITFSRFGTGSDVVIFRAPASTAPERPPALLSISQGRARDPMWSASPDRLMYRSFHDDAEHGDLYIAGIDPDSGMSGPERVRVEVDGAILWPVWSPDGERVYFSRRLGGGESGLFVHDIENERTERLLDREVLVGDPVPSLDASGRWLLMTNHTDAGPPPNATSTRPPGRHLLDLDTGTLRQLDDRTSPATLAPDGTWFASVRDDGAEIVRREIADPGDLETLVRSPAGWQIADRAAISPDGQRIAFVTERQEPEWMCPDSRLWVAALADGTPVAFTEADDWSPTWATWSPDGRHLAVRTWVCEDSLMRFRFDPRRTNR